MNQVNTMPQERRDTAGSAFASEPLSKPKLQDLVPIVMVIVGGCKPCAENMVKRALQQGSSWHDIDKTLQIVAGMQKLNCFAKAVGPEVIGRMEKPLAAGRRTLEQARSIEGR
jgi:hypothetical protein